MATGHERQETFKCPVCGSGEYYTDPAGVTKRGQRVRYCIPCENAKEDRERANKAKWEREKRKPRQR